MDTVSNPKSIRDHRGKSTKADSWAGEGTGGQDVVVDGGVGWVCVDAGQGPALTAAQVPQSKQMTVEALTCWQKSIPVQRGDHHRGINCARRWALVQVRGRMEAWWRIH